MTAMAIRFCPFAWSPAFRRVVARTPLGLVQRPSNVRVVRSACGRSLRAEVADVGDAVTEDADRRADREKGTPVEFLLTVQKLGILDGGTGRGRVTRAVRVGCSCGDETDTADRTRHEHYLVEPAHPCLLVTLGRCGAMASIGMGRA